MTANWPGDQPGDTQPLDQLFWRDEILQVMYWYRGEGFGAAIAARDLQPFLTVDEAFIGSQLERLVAEGYLVREGAAEPVRYGFTASGEREGARRFADEFAGLTGQAHGECGPDCPHCKNIPRDRCVHCAPQAASG